jgi:hypothetical protein
MSTIERRVSALEEASFAGGGGECSECGDGDDKPYEVVFDNQLPDNLEENCQGCGRELITTIYFEDDLGAPWNRVGARQEGAE